MSERAPVGTILALGLTQIIGYGTLYYSFSILAPDMARGLNWSTEWIFAALSAALLLGGLTAPYLGRAIDHFGAGQVMTAGSAIAAAALIVCAYAPGKSGFVAALIVVEIAANLVQYGAAFALLVQASPRTAQRSITYLTLIAGFASTIFWPITTALHAHLSWQNVYLVFAALNLLVCLPLHAWLSYGLAKGRAQKQAGTAQIVEGSLSPDVRQFGFKLMVVGFSLQSLVSAAILVHMVPLLSGLGLGATAAIVGTLFGPSQVLSRFANMVLGGNLPPLALATIAATLIPGGVLILTLTAPSVAGAMAFAVVFGLGSGLFSIVTGTLPLMLFGSDGYGRLQGKVMAARLILSATAPFALAFAIAHIGTTWSLTITTALGACAIVAFLAIARLERRHKSRDHLAGRPA
ncbi:arsenite efflux MFS transporter ArsK (plasmid) [Agrobacterium tumefaciens]|nr:arsenite efflux MFS transporter ArsK [Agrobacterium tumefaciens]CUX66993.1 putative major facilitator transporter [Agrobacterium genomosp. 5 str. CFBP 6626]